MSKQPRAMALADDICGPPSGTVLTHLNDLPAHGGKSIEFQNEEGHRLSIFVQKLDEDIEVYLNRCPHAGTPLNLFNDRFMDLDNTYLLCRTHGAKFEYKNGKCIAGPCKGEYLRKVAFSVNDDGSIVSE
ncbi:Rieske 2Fe-2S domain-containing protein [Kordiimonas sp. SCSIO 12610]|uniref:Rieske (2Fe-2S) protein n=1 Tax=Kordiimonas sp. SCSIO 12610 TaxID=2829597 RepID=UPI00210CBDC1|nr:Rieske 2Fe-2S domain-containing protein [Kordiimonas sp. SCSIO 12610]UTW55296.1 Rieske 2Fe-2S domain-containing protein [Kordiimonas sp. SCSIO 12610]